jgi:hypothetical protein
MACAPFGVASCMLFMPTHTHLSGSWAAVLPDPRDVQLPASLIYARTSLPLFSLARSALLQPLIWPAVANLQVLG